MRSSGMRCLAAVIAATTLLAQPAPGSASRLARGLPPPRAATRPWFVVETPRFTVFSQEDQAAARKIARTMERLAEIVTSFTRLPVAPSRPVRVFAFRSEADGAPYREALQPGTSGIAGMYLPRPEGSYVFLATDGRSEFASHELAHHLLRLSLAELPLWLDEGLAEFYSTFTVIGGIDAPSDPARAVLGNSLRQHVKTLRAVPLRRLRELFAVTPRSPEYNESVRRGVFYAESWALVHYLLLGNTSRTEQLHAFLARMHQGERADPAFLAAFGTDLGSLEEELARYVSRGRLPSRIVELAPLVPTAFTARALRRDEALAHLGEFLAQSSTGLLEAERHLRAALELNPQNGPAADSLARVLERRDGREPGEATGRRREGRTRRD